MEQDSHKVVVYKEGRMKNLKVRKLLKALKDYGCIEIRNTSHGVITENPHNKNQLMSQHIKKRFLLGFLTMF